MTEQATQLTGRDTRPRSADEQLRRRASAVIPGGMYGHQSAVPLPPRSPSSCAKAWAPGCGMWTGTSTWT